MGQLVPQSGGRAVAAAGANPWADAGKGVADGAYLKFNGNTGVWSYGQDDEELPDGSRVIADMETLAFGWICWVESAVEEEILVPVIDGRPPLEHDLPDHGPFDDDDDGWREAASLSLVLESYGDDDQDEAVGTPLLWKSSTAGQVRQFRKLSAAYGRVFAQHPGEMPVIELGAESYMPKVKKHGKKWSPILKIVGWVTAEEMAGLAAVDEDDDYEEPAPKKASKKDDAPARGRRAPEPEPEEEEEEEAPAPRRGRRAPEPEEEDEPEAPAPRRGRKAAEPEEEEEDEPEAPAPRRGRRAAAEPEEEAPAPRRGRRADPEPEEEEEEEAPAPRRGRGAAGGGRRVRNFD